LGHENCLNKWELKGNVWLTLLKIKEGSGGQKNIVVFPTARKNIKDTLAL